MSLNSDSPNIPPTLDGSLLAGRYQLLDKLGAGGMGVVFRAQDCTLNRLVAIKILPVGKLQDADAVARFRREALALAKLSHPHIIPAHDSGQDGDKHFLIMAWIEGRSLSAELLDKGRLPPARAADYVRQAALGLHYAHRFGLVHRDVKPSNLLLGVDGHVYLLDLGLARFLQDQIGDEALTHTGVCMGTPDYCAPEQFRDAHRADVRSDIYSLGCTLYHLIAGKAPFPGSSLSEKAKAHQNQEPPSLAESCPDIPGGLALVLARMMAKRPADRFASMAEVAEALAPYAAAGAESLRELGATATWNGGQLEIRRPSRRWRAALLWAAAAMMLLALGISVGFSFHSWHNSRTAVAPNNPDDIGAPSARSQKPAAIKVDDGKAAVPTKTNALDDPRLLTVSKEPKTGGRFRSLTEALAAVRQPNTTIRVLDDAEYSEQILLQDKTIYAGLTLESPRRATLVVNASKDAAVRISRLPRATIRGFRIRPDKLAAGVEIAGDCPGVILEDLQIASAAVAVRVKQIGLKPDAPPIVIQDCTLNNCQTGIRISGLDSATKQAQPSNRAIVRRNRLDQLDVGIVLEGQLSKIQIVANRISHCKLAGIRLSDLRGGTHSILVANNTIENRQNCIQIQEPIGAAANVRLSNNFLRAEVSPDISVDANARQAVASWQVDHNARPVFADRAAGKSSPLPPNRDWTAKELGSPTSAGAGAEDPSLPVYIGAESPKGALPWDWDRTWRISKGARLLTVSKNQTNGGKYRTINDALKDVRPWDTIRVLDEAEYRECLSLKDKAKFEGLAVEAPKRATLVMGKGDRRALDVRGVPYLRIGGFRFRDSDKTPSGNRVLVSVTGDVTGMTLADLEIKADTYGVGILLQQVATAGEPLVVTRCSIDTFNDGVLIVGNPSLGSCRGLRLSHNRVRAGGPGTRGVLLIGALEDVQVTGNFIYGCKTTSLQIEDPAPSLRRVLLANNTVCNGGNMGFRLIENRTPKTHVAGQIEFSTNLLFGCGGTDAAYIIDEMGVAEPGDVKELMQSWRFRCNARDMSGSAVTVQIPRADTDRLLTESDLLSTTIDKLDRIRPGSQSPLATLGINGGPGLPAYVGALPPDGVEHWDWDRTWRTRMRLDEK